MAHFRSKSYNDGTMQIEPYYGPPSTTRPDELRSYSISYAAPPAQKVKKGKSSKWWSLNDPEFQRKRRVASYRVYSVEGRVKGSLGKSFRWLKDRYTQVVHGWW